jgi:hypothetical protein
VQHGQVADRSRANKGRNHGQQKRSEECSGDYECTQHFDFIATLLEIVVY